MWHAWERRGMCTGCWWESQKERDHLEDRGVDGIRMDLMECRLDPAGSGQGSVAGSCEYGDEPSGSGTTELVRASVTLCWCQPVETDYAARPASAAPFFSRATREGGAPPPASSEVTVQASVPLPWCWGIMDWTWFWRYKDCDKVNVVWLSLHGGLTLHTKLTN
jgi:hypothetical protein